MDTTSEAKVAGFLQIFIGAVFGILCTIVLSPALAAINDGENRVPFVAIAIVSIVALLGWAAPTVRRSFGRGFLTLGVCFYALPISSFLLAGRAAHEVVSASSDQAIAIVGAGLAGVAVTGLSAFFGLILGTIFTITGLVLALGGQREVIVINR